MDKAVISADYYNFEYKKGLKVCRLTFEVPYEHAKLVRDVLGDPPLPGEQVKVAIARIVMSAEPTGAQAPRSPSEVPPEKRTYTRSQMAALKCQDKDFQAWLIKEYPDIWADSTWGTVAVEGIVNNAIKTILGITSKTELDSNPLKAAALDRLLTTFTHRDNIR